MPMNVTHLTVVVLVWFGLGTLNVSAGERYPRICLEQLQLMDVEYQQQFEGNFNWSRPDYDQSQWPLESLDYLEQTGTVCWFRTHFVLSQDLEPFEHKGFVISQAGAYEVYLDGTLLGGSGTVGYTREVEVPGPHRIFLPIPDELYSQGHHVIGIKTSNFHRLPLAKDFNYTLLRTDVPSVNVNLDAPYIWNLLSLSGCLLVAFYYLSNYLLVNRNRAFLLLSILSFAVSAFALVSITYYLPIPYYLFKVSTVSAVSLAAFSCWLLPVFLAEMYNSEKIRVWLVLASIVIFTSLLLPLSWHEKEMLALGGCLLLSLLLVANAIRERKVGAIAVFLGTSLLLAALIYEPENFLIERFSAAFLVLIACLLTSLSLQIRAMNKAYDEAKLTASKLEIALLKKNIQPHFLMNTLTAVIECLEFDPPQAVKFITALAEEFDLICRVSDKRLIKVSDEIELCQHHLDIMGFQKQMHYSLQLSGIDRNAQVPPGLFHTLVENGITHNLYRQQSVTFYLSQASVLRGRTYTMLTPKADKVTTNKVGTGMGDKYLQMRLDESYPRRWKLEQNDTDEGWLTCIYIEDP